MSSSEKIITTSRLAESLNKFNERGVLPVKQDLQSLSEIVSEMGSNEVVLSLGTDGKIYATYEEK